MPRVPYALACYAALFLCACCAIDRAGAQQKKDDVIERRRLTPGLVLNTNGRQGPCDVLAFVRGDSGDGYSLMATGDDKVVRFWKVNGDVDPDSMRLLRWPIFREHRGSIHTVALSPHGGKTIAVAGVGLSNSSLALLDRSTGHVEKFLPFGPRNKAVFALTFSPDGKHVAFGLDDGSVWLWDLASAEKEPFRQLLEGDAKRPTDRVGMLAFLDDSRLLAATQDGRVREMHLRQRNPEGRELTHFQSNNLTKIVLSPDQRWLAATVYDPKGKVGEVEVLSLKGDHRKILKAPRADCFPTCLAWDAKSARLAVGMQEMNRKSAFPTVLGGRVCVYDLPNLQAPVAEMERHYYPEALAFHPEKHNLLASAGGDNNEVFLWDLRSPAKPLSTIRGAGSSLWGVGLSADNRYLGFKDDRKTNPIEPNDRGTGAWRVFDLKQRHFTAGHNFKPVTPLESVDGWRVEPDPEDGYRWFVKHGNRKWGLEKELYNKSISDIPRCYTFVKPEGKNPARLAVGHYWGISVYDLDANKGPKLVRRMDGHEAEVMALAPSADGQNLVSASRDQTIAGWTLAGWDHQHELGATFKPAGHLLVEKVDLFSPAWEVGLAPEDRVMLLLLPGGEYYKDPEFHLNMDKPMLPDGSLIFKEALKKPVSREAALAYLRNPIPHQEMTFQWQTPDKQVRAGVTTVRQRPLWKFFPARNDEWVLYRWRDYYYDCSTHGDKFVGWHQNAERNARDQTPHFYPLERYSERFHRPDKITEGLRAFANDPKKAFTEAFAEIEAPLVEIKVDNPKPNNLDVTVTITIKSRSNDKGQLIDRVILWRDDYDIKFNPPANKVYNEFKIKVPKEDLHRGLNRFKLVAYNQALGRGEATTTVDFTADGGRPKQGTLYALCVGINDYSKVKGFIPDGSDSMNLKACVNDARSLEGILEKQSVLHHVEKPVLLLDGAATAEAILAEIEKIRKKAGPDDLFVLSLAGHGVAPEIENDKEIWFFACYNTRAGADGRNTRLDNTALSKVLGSMKCRKLVLLDACHSGSVVDPIRALTRNGFPLTIFAACRKNETAGELPDGKHGIFTQSLISAVEGNTKFNRKDKAVLDARELADYLSEDVPRRAKKNGKEEGQHPVFLPDQPDRVPLFQVLHTPDRGEKSARRSRP